MQGEGRHGRGQSVTLGCGIGLRPVYFGEILAEPPAIDWFEALSENYMVAGGNPRRVLRRVRERFPVALHGVSLSIGAAEPVDAQYVDHLAALVDEIDPAFVSDHLCWAGVGGHSAHDLWPLPLTEESLALVVDKVGRVQDRLGRRILLENPSSYAEFAASAIPEWDFIAEVARRADCGILLDVNNVFVSAFNHGFAPQVYIDAMPRERVGYLHLAGHSDLGDLLLDTHDAPVPADVWWLYEDTLRRLGPLPTLVERDDEYPPLSELLAEAERARTICRRLEDAACRTTA